LAVRAILAVYDKRDIVDFARGLHDLGWELIGTGGTARTVSEAGLPITEVAEYTGSPEMLGGRVKTLHPKVHGGILYRRGHVEDEAEVAQYEIPSIDLLASNLYPFIETVTGGESGLSEALEQIDIGGPTMIRAAAKNHPWVLPVVSPDDYPAVLEALSEARTSKAGGKAAGAAGESADVGQDLRRRLAAKAFQHVAHYDTAVAEYLRGDDDPFPAQFTAAATLLEQSRYGENPHQRGAFYRLDSVRAPAEGIGGFEQRHGKAMSYVNFLDADAAFNVVADFEAPAVAIIKHTNAACLATSADADATVTGLYERALTEGDYVSAYGGIVATNRLVDMDLATALRDVRSPESGVRMFYEIVIAPGYDEDALAHLKKKSKGLRILTAPLGEPRRQRFEVRSTRGGLLVQDSDVSDDQQFEVASERRPTASEEADIRTGWIVSKHVKSNAVVFVKDGVLIGMGAGQPNRVGSAELCAQQAGERAQGAVAATDALIPFPDTVEVCARAGCSVVVHTAGSIRDDEVIATANELGVSLIATGVRHFRH
jgi:phosphoribosylaminoimidazolecarboxamide formyltransferase/IMP cyclohydrolase